MPARCFMDVQKPLPTGGGDRHRPSQGTALSGCQRLPAGSRPLFLGAGGGPPPSRPPVLLSASCQPKPPSPAPGACRHPRTFALVSGPQQALPTGHFQAPCTAPCVPHQDQSPQQKYVRPQHRAQNEGNAGRSRHRLQGPGRGQTPRWAQQGQLPRAPQQAPLRRLDWMRLLVWLRWSLWSP